MKSLAKYLALSTLALSIPALAVEDTEVGKAEKVNSFRYGLSIEDTYDTNGKSIREEKWVSVKSGHLGVAIRDDLKAYRINANANLGTLLGVSETRVAKEVLNRIQFEAGAETDRPAYILAGTEMRVMKPLSLFVAGVAQKGKGVRPVGGPIVYFGDKSNSSLFYYLGTKDSATKHSFSLRNRIREWDMFWFDIEASYKIAKAETKDLHHPLGASMTVGVWKTYVKLAQVPYWEGSKFSRRTAEVGVNAAF